MTDESFDALLRRLESELFGIDREALKILRKRHGTLILGAAQGLMARGALNEQPASEGALGFGVAPEPQETEPAIPTGSSQADDEDNRW
jgi:hypothetical protein